MDNNKKDKFLLLFVPVVNKNSDVFVCLRIITGAQFVSIMLFFFAFIYFYNALYSTFFQSLIGMLLCIVYLVSGCFLYLSTCFEKYIYAEISYILYEIVFFAKSIDYIIILIVELYNFYYDFTYYPKILSVVLGGTVELGIMSYFLFVIYCYLYIIDTYNNTLNKVGAEYQELLKDSNNDVQEYDTLK